MPRREGEENPINIPRAVSTVCLLLFLLLVSSSSSGGRRGGRRGGGRGRRRRRPPPPRAPRVRRTEEKGEKEVRRGEACQAFTKRREEGRESIEVDGEAINSERQTEQKKFL